jgi:hypothetical protein
MANGDQIDLDALIAPHGFQDSVTWALTPTGLSIAGAAPLGSGGRVVTMRRIWITFGGSIVGWSQAQSVPAELIMACIATETSGRADAVREEPGYVDDDTTPNKVSPGLMQTLISTARSALDDAAIDRAWLLQPDNSIRAGTAYIAGQSGATAFDPPKVACAYNAGSLRHDSSLGNRWKMRQYPLGSSAHADRFVQWFNNCKIRYNYLILLPCFTVSQIFV